jgi:hypothetical protein
MLHVVPLLHNSILHRIADLQHRPRGSRLISTHDILDHDAIVALLLRSQDRPTDNRGVLMLGKVLRAGC